MNLVYEEKKILFCNENGNIVLGHPKKWKMQSLHRTEGVIIKVHVLKCSIRSLRVAVIIANEILGIRC